MVAFAEGRGSTKAIHVVRVAAENKVQERRFLDAPEPRRRSDDLMKCQVVYSIEQFGAELKIRHRHLIHPVDAWGIKVPKYDASVEA